MCDGYHTEADAHCMGCACIRDVDIGEKTWRQNRMRHHKALITLIKAKIRQAPHDTEFMLTASRATGMKPPGTMSGTITP
jgi:hypothetical protein